MSVTNQTTVTEFWLTVFQSVPNLKTPLFILFLVIYICILSSNLLIIMLVSTGHSLKAPMYFFLAHLSLSDIIFTTTIIPNMLYIILKGGESITLSGCLVQLYLLGSSVSTQCFLLAVMSYDRYLAICNPMHCTSIMNFKLRLQLATGSWISGYFLLIITISPIGSLEFCGPNVIDHFFCDAVPLLEISCSDNSVVLLQDLIVGTLITLMPFGFIFGTYVCIFITILKISTTTGRQKAFLTCSSHLIVACIFYGTLITLYVIPTKEVSSNVTKVQSILYTTVTPFFNPIIYSLRSSELRVAIIKIVIRRIGWQRDKRVGT